jgi:large subunit ribosomal protein L5
VSGLDREQKLKILDNPTREIKIGKIVLNIGVGKSGETLEKAKKVLELLVPQNPSQRKAKRTIRDFGIHKGEPIAVMVTQRGKQASELLKRLLDTKEMKIPVSSFDMRGNCSFGIKEHIEIPGVKYDPDIGIFGLNASIMLERPGYRVIRRKRMRTKVGKNHIILKDEGIKFFREKIGVTVD